jgi:hypothetical protein
MAPRSSPRCLECKGLLGDGFICSAWDAFGLPVDVCVSCCVALRGSGDGWASVCGRPAVGVSAAQSGRGCVGLCWLQTVRVGQAVKVGAR